MGLPPLNPLSSLGVSDSTIASAASAASGAATSAATGAANLVTGGQAGFFAWLVSGQGVAFIIGLILIIAGLFTLESTKELVVKSAKAVGAGAAVAA